jgi:hypothetical protein
MDAPGVVDFSRTGRRLRWSLGALAAVVVVFWLAVGLLGDGGLRLRLLGELAGWALLAGFVVEVVVVGGSALAGMLRAGARGDRLAGPDVSLVPPQLRRRR